MIGYWFELVSKYSDHPMLVSCIAVAVIFAAISVIVENTTGNGVAAAHLMLYAVVAIFLSAVGYFFLFTGKMIRKARYQY